MFIRLLFNGTDLKVQIIHLSLRNNNVIDNIIMQQWKVSKLFLLMFGETDACVASLENERRMFSRRIDLLIFRHVMSCRDSVLVDFNDVWCGRD